MRVIHLVSNKAWGGGEQYVYDICRHLAADGHDVTIIHKPIPVLRDKLSQLNIPLHEMSLGGILDLESARRLSRLIASGSSILHVHNFKDAFTAAYARKISGNPLVRIVLTRHLVRPGKRSFMYRWLYRQLDRIIFVSKLAQDRFLEGMPQSVRDKSTVLHNSITIPDSITAPDLRKQLELPADSTILMYHGRIEQEKGIDILVKAFAAVRADNLHLVLVGTGSQEYSQSLNESIQNQGLHDRVHFTGFRSDIIACIQEAGLGVIPSIVAEACPLSCMEYMSQGKCVITTCNGGQAEYIRDGVTGILVPPADTQALADAITRAVTTHEADTIGQAAARWFSTNLSYDVFYSRLTDIYKKLF